MTNEELKDWFWNLYNSCYPIYKNENIFMCYDINFIRKKKLGNILNKEVEYPTEIKGDVLFMVDDKYFWINEDMWKKLFYKFNNYILTQNLIRENINNYDILKGKIPNSFGSLQYHYIYSEKPQIVIYGNS